jgi:hypothetical protein
MSWPATPARRAGGGRKPRRHPEQDLQQQVVRHLSLVLPPPPDGPVWFAPDPGLPPYVPGGSSEQLRARILEHAAKVAGIRKSMGVKAGIPDLVFLGRRPFAIELKAPTGGVVSDDQTEMHAALESVGVAVHVARSIVEVEQALRDQGVQLRGRVSA